MRPIVLLAVALACRTAGGHEGDHADPVGPPPLRAEAAPAPPPPAAQNLVERSARRTREHPDDPQAWVNWGDALMQWSREGSGAAEYERAEAAYRQALKLDPRRAGALVGLAWVANSRHQFAEGRRYAQQALELDPHAAEPHALLGDAAVEAGDYEAAFKHYQASLDLRPDLSSYARSAHLLWLTGDARRATFLMRKAIAAGSPHAENTAWCRAELALMLFNTGALTLAEKEIAEARRQSPDNPQVLAAYGRIKAGQRKYAEAIEGYERALTNSPSPLAVMAALVDLYELSGTPTKAEVMSRRLLALAAPESDAMAAGSPDRHSHPHPHPHPPGNAELARFLADRGVELDRALAEAQAAAEQSKSVAVTDTLAWCLYKTGDYPRAKEVVLEALRWHTPDANLLFHAGMIHAAGGDRPAAQRYLYQALSLNPAFHPVHASMAAEKLREWGASPGSPKAGSSPEASAPNSTARLP